MSYADRSTTKPLTGTVFYVLLALADEDRYGLGIVQEVERRTAGDVQLGPGTLYNAIKKMVQEGFIAEVTETGSGDDPRRRYYRITKAGRAALGTEAERLERLVGAARLKKVLPVRR